MKLFDVVTIIEEATRPVTQPTRDSNKIVVDGTSSSNLSRSMLQFATVKDNPIPPFIPNYLKMGMVDTQKLNRNSAMANRARGQNMGRTAELRLLPTEAIQKLLPKPRTSFRDFVKGDRGIVGGHPDSVIYNFIDETNVAFDPKSPFKSIDVTGLRKDLEQALQTAANAREEYHLDGDPLKSTLLPVYIRTQKKTGEKKSTKLEPLGFNFYEYIAWYMVTRFIELYGMTTEDIKKYSKRTGTTNGAKAYGDRVVKRIGTLKVGAVLPDIPEDEHLDYEGSSEQDEIRSAFRDMD